MQTEALRPCGLFVLLEGCRIPAISVTAITPSQNHGAISVVIPYHPSLWPPKWKIEKRADDAETIVDENGLTIINDVTVSGMQPQTRVQVFVNDPHSGESVLLQEGRIIGTVQRIRNVDNTYIAFTAFCSGAYPQEIQLYMSDRSRSLGISSSSDWSGELGAASPSEIASRIQSAGLSQGILAELENAGLNSNFFLHILWRMMRYDRRFMVIDNPQALGYFNGSRLKTIFEKTISKYENKDSIARVIQYILLLLRYNSFNVPFPSFIASESAEASGEIEDLSLDEAIDIETATINDFVCCPSLTNAPPPRCNVIFPNQYGQRNSAFSFSQQPTRMIVRATGTGKITQDSASDIVVKPDNMREKIISDRNYNSPEETYRGIVFSSGGLKAPEFMSEMGSDYVKGFYSASWDKVQSQLGEDIGSGPFNPRIIPGLPVLVLDPDGNHIVGDVDVTHVLQADGTKATAYKIYNARPYDDPIASNSGDLWYEQNIFGPEHIGIYFYPHIIGKYDGENLDLDWTEQDLSILAVLNTGELSDEDLRAAKEDQYAIKNAADVIFEEYNRAVNKGEYARRFGRRSQIGFREFLEDFYHCSISSDEYMATGGYTLATNTISTVDNEVMNEIELGERIPDDATIRGCYFRERQEAYVQAMQFFIKTKNIPINQTYMDGALNASRDAIRSLINLVEPDSSIRTNALGVLGILEDINGST